MDLAQATQLAGAFVSGGLAKAILDYRLNDRATRRAGLRPTDHARIATIRAVMAQAHIQRTQVDHDEFDQSKVFETLTPALSALDDLKLVRYWGEYMFRLNLVPHAQSPYFTLSSQMNSPIWDRYMEAASRVMLRLNKLERRR